MPMWRAAGGNDDGENVDGGGDFIKRRLHAVPKRVVKNALCSGISSKIPSPTNKIIFITFGVFAHVTVASRPVVGWGNSEVSRVDGQRARRSIGIDNNIVFITCVVCEYFFLFTSFQFLFFANENVRLFFATDLSTRTLCHRRHDCARSVRCICIHNWNVYTFRHY